MIEFVVNTELLLIEQWLYRNQRDCFPEMIQTEQGYLSLPAGLKMIYSDQSERHLAKQVVHFTTIDNESVGGFPFNAVTFTLTALATQRTKVRVACERRKLNTAVEQLLSKAAGDYPEAYTAIDAGIRREFYNLPPAGTARKAAGNGSEAAQVEHPAYGTFGVEMWGKINPGHEDKFVEIVCDMAGISPRAIGYQMEPLEAELPGHKSDGEAAGLPKTLKKRKEWAKAYYLGIEPLAAEYRDLWEEGVTDDPKPTPRDYIDRVSHVINKTYSARHIRNIMKQGELGNLEPYKP